MVCAEVSLEATFWHDCIVLGTIPTGGRWLNLGIERGESVLKRRLYV